MKQIAPLIAIIVLFVIASAAYVVRENEMAVVFQFGGIVRTDSKPGLKFKVPLIQTVRKYDNRLLSLNVEQERYLTSEKKYVMVDFFVKWKIRDARRFVTAFRGSEQDATQRLNPIVRQALGKEINRLTLSQVVSDQRTSIMTSMAKAIDKQANELGIEIKDVRIKRIDLPDTVLDSVFLRMRSERTKVANELRSTGNQQAETIRAEADRKRQVLLAEAEGYAQGIRGEGDANAASIYAAANSKDPEFYSFYRSMQAYREGLSGENSVMVLDRKSDLFKYFNDPKAR